MALAGVAALLLAGLGQRYRIDQVRCASWPPFSRNLLAAALYAVAVAGLSWGWLRWLRCSQRPGGPSTLCVLAWAAALYLLAGLGPPALSDDALFYAAIGRALQAGHSALEPLCQSLPPDDAWLQLMPPHWRCGNSAYYPGFHAVAALIARVAGKDLSWHLRGHQLVSGLAMLGAAGLTALALRGSALRPAYGATLVALNPLAVIEAPSSAHNDALLALTTAATVLAYSRRQRGAAMLSQALAVSIKASGLLLTVLLAGAQLVRPLAPPSGRRPNRIAVVLRLGTALVVLAVTAALLLHLRPAALFGPSQLPWEYCTRSLECLPRSILRTLLHRPQAAAYVAVAFRLVAGLWLLFAAWRAAQVPSQILGWMGTGLLIYYLYLHPWSQSWYLLSLLPLAPWLSGRPLRALRSVSISATAYYALVFIGNCLQDDLAIAATDLMEALIVMVPPTVCLLQTPPAQPMPPASPGETAPATRRPPPLSRR